MTGKRKPPAPKPRRKGTSSKGRAKKKNAFRAFKKRGAR